MKASHLKIKVKRKKRVPPDPTIIENFMKKGLKSVMYSESSSDSGDDTTEQVFLEATNSEVEDKSKVNDDPDTFHSLLEASTISDMIDTALNPNKQENLHEITSVFVKQEVKDTFENELDIKIEPEDFDNICDPGSPGFHDYSNPASPLAELLELPVSPVTVIKSNLLISEVHSLSAPIQLYSSEVHTLSAPIRPKTIQLYLSEDGSVSQSKPKTKIPTNGPIKEFACEASNCGKSYNFRNEREQHFHGCHPELSNPEERGKRTCTVCLKFFSKVQHMKAHFDAEHKNVVFQCPSCPTSFKIKNSLTKHIKRNHQFICPNCSVMFDTKNKLQTHWESDHKDMEFPFLRVGEVACDICNKIMCSQNSLARHKLEIHENIKKIRSRSRPCTICKENCIGSYQKMKHMRDVHKNGEILKRKCLLCNSEFELYDDFKSHVEAHKDHSICMICGDHFPDSYAQVTHINLVHKQYKYSTLDKNYSCDICGHRVAIKPQIEHHMRKHSKEQNFYICDVCGKSYKFLPPFLYHKQTHTKRMDFCCDLCGKFDEN